jgi:hypothetical protein
MLQKSVMTTSLKLGIKAEGGQEVGIKRQQMLAKRGDGAKRVRRR